MSEKKKDFLVSYENVLITKKLEQNHLRKQNIKTDCIKRKYSMSL